jgi:hypothetical protein
MKLRKSKQLSRERMCSMKSKKMTMIAAIAGELAAMGGWAIAAQDKYTVKVPSGIAFSDFRGYED